MRFLSGFVPILVVSVVTLAACNTASAISIDNLALDRTKPVGSQLPLASAKGAHLSFGTGTLRRLYNRVGWAALISPRTTLRDSVL